MRSTLALSIVLLAASQLPAAADTDLVLLGPAAEADVPAAQVAHLKQELDKVAVAPLGGKSINALCAADTTCIAGAGIELRARRVIAVSVAGRGGKLAIGLLLVDVAAKELIGKRDLEIADRALGKELGPAVRKFIDEAPVARAKDLFTEGNQHYALGEFAEALESYKNAYRVKPLAAFLFNIAQCHRKLGHNNEAVQMYQSYLVGVPDAENKKLVESLIAESKAAIAQDQKIARDKAATDARLESERIVAGKKRAEEERKAKEAEAISAVEQRKAEQARLQAQREREEIYNHHPARTWAVVGGTLGAGAMVTGGVFALLSRSAQSRFDSAGCGDPSQLLGARALATCRDDQTRGQKDARLANLLLAGGGAALAVALVVFVIDPGNVERPDEPRAAVAISPTSVQVVVKW